MKAGRLKQTPLIVLSLLFVLPLQALCEPGLRGLLLLEDAQGELTPARDVPVTHGTTGVAVRTDEQGLFKVPLGESDRPGAPLRLLVDKPGWVIHSSLEGEVRIGADGEEPAKIRLLRKGSERLWSNTLFEVLAIELIDAAKRQVTPDAELQGIDYSDPIRDSAERYGFEPDEVRLRLDRWAGEERDDLYREGLAAFARKDLGKAEGLFIESAEAATQAREQREQDEAVDASALHDRAVRDYRLAGDTAFADYRFSTARDHYRTALSLLDRNAQPELGAEILHNLAAANYELGARAGDADAAAHLVESANALKGALDLQTLEKTPRHWAQTQAMLLRVYEDLRDAAGMVAVVGELLRAEPDNRDYYKLAHALNHEVLFDFENAHSLTADWLERYPDDMDALCNLAETYFTTGRFEPAQVRLETLIESEQLPPELEAAMRLVEISNLLAMGKPDELPERQEDLRRLVGDQSEEFAVGWAFEGSSHFIGQHPALADYRGMLFGLLWAAETGRRDALLAAIDKARRELSPNP